MRNYALQKGPCTFLDLRISPWGILFLFLLCSSSLSLFYPLSGISSVPGAASLSGGSLPAFPPRHRRRSGSAQVRWRGARRLGSGERALERVRRRRAAGAMSGGRQLREGGTRCGRRRARAGASGAGAEHSAGAGRTGAGAARSASGAGAARSTGVRVELWRGARDSDVRGLLSLSKQRWSRAARERLRHASGAGARGGTQLGRAQERRSKARASTGPAAAGGGIAAQDDNV
jgi:hypothetical protein